MLKKGTFLCMQETKHCTCLSRRAQQHHEPGTELKITCAIPSVQPQRAAGSAVVPGSTASGETCAAPLEGWLGEQEGSDL